MRSYWMAVFRNLGGASFDVIFVAVVSMSPILVGRMISISFNKSSEGDYLDFLFNGQLAFFSMGPLAALLLLCLRKKLPDKVTLVFGSISVGCLLFLVGLVGADPTLQRATTWIGWSALILLGFVLVIRIIAEAMKSVAPSDALEAGAEASRKTQTSLEARMSGNRA